MADDLIHPDDRPDPGERFRADLAGYLHTLSGPELADLLAGLSDPVTVDLIAALAARGPAHARLPATWPAHPDSEFLRRRAARAVVADRRAARAARRAGPPPGAALTGWAANRPQVTRPSRDPAVERRLGEALRGSHRRAGRAGGDGVRRNGLPAGAGAARAGLAGLVAARRRALTRSGLEPQPGGGLPWIA